MKDLNPHSLTILNSAFVEPSLASAKPGDTFQFERLGYFCMDAEREGGGESAPLLFNRVVTLKDTWAGGETICGEDSYMDKSPTLILNIE